MVFAGLYPDRQRPVRAAARRAGQAQAQRRQPAVRAGNLHGAGLRIPLRLPRACCTWRSSRSGWSASSTSTSSPRSRRWSTTSTSPTAAMMLLENPDQPPRPGDDRAHRGAVREGPHHGADRVHRRHHEAGPGAPRRLPRDEIPRHHPGRVRLRLPARRDRPRLLRQAEGHLARLRGDGLRAGGLPRDRTWCGSTC